jgi:DNA-binding transcriptional ArsR family regulator
MSYALVNQAIAQPLPPARRAVLLALADMANAAGTCWPSIATIARRACMSVRSIFTHLKALEGMGLLTRRQRIGRSSLYSLTGQALAPSTPAPADAASTPTASAEQATSAPAPELTPTHQPAQQSAPAPAVLTVETVVQAMRRAGLVGAYETQSLAALVDSASDMDEFTEAASAASKKGMGFAWALARVEGKRKDANRPPVHADVSRCTVPGMVGRDPVLIQLEQDAAKATAPPASIRERLARLKAEIVGAVAGSTAGAGA